MPAHPRRAAVEPLGPDTVGDLGPARITVGVAASAWMIGWIGGQVAGSVVASVLGHTGDAADRPVWATAVTSLALWAPQIAVLVAVSRRFGSGRPLADYRARFAPVDLIGLPIGVLTQLVLLKVVYWPLQSWWPGTFSTKNLEENARSLWDSAPGLWVVVLLAVVALGAPIVEEFVYRGLLHGALRRRCAEWVGVVGVAAFFAAIHFRPVEFPGLFVFGLVVGTTVALTGRIGMAIATHIAFNATALALIA